MTPRMTDTIQNSEGVEAVRAVTAEMRRFMPNACGDWADKIDAALAAPQPLTVAESGELAGYIHGKDYRDNTVEAVEQRKLRFNDLLRRDARYRHSLAREPATADVEREDIARLIALAGLGTITGQPREPHGEWTREDFEARILTIIPTHCEQQCFALADTILTALSRAAPSSERCPGCDGTGDMVLPDGEWMGICPCPAGDHLRAQSSEPAIAEGERACTCHPDDRPASRQHRYANTDCLSAFAQSSTPPAIAETDLPDRFEAWWRAHPQHNRNPATYADKKQIAWGAFYVATVSATSTPPASKGVEADRSKLIATLRDFHRLMTTKFDPSKMLGVEYDRTMMSNARKLVANLPFVIAALSDQPTPSNDTLQGRGEMQS